MSCQEAVTLRHVMTLCIISTVYLMFINVIINKIASSSSSADLHVLDLFVSFLFTVHILVLSSVLNFYMSYYLLLCMVKLLLICFCKSC